MKDDKGRLIVEATDEKFMQWAAEEMEKTDNVADKAEEEDGPVCKKSPVERHHVRVPERDETVEVRGEDSGQEEVNEHGETMGDLQPVHEGQSSDEPVIEPMAVKRKSECETLGNKKRKPKEPEASKRKSEIIGEAEFNKTFKRKGEIIGDAEFQQEKESRRKQQSH